MSFSQTLARYDDPVTSKIAARKLYGINEKQLAVWQLLRQHRAGLTDEALVERYLAEYARKTGHMVPWQSASGLRTRRHELVERGMVVPAGRFARTRSGRNAIVWKVAR